MFDEQPDGDPHGECAAEICRLQAEIAALRAAGQALINECVTLIGGTGQLGELLAERGYMLNVRLTEMEALISAAPTPPSEGTT